MFPWGAPEVVVLDSANVTAPGNVSVSFAVDKSVKWVGYSLDGAEKVVVLGNFTLTDLTAGSHSLTVYATDIYGASGASDLSVSLSKSIPKRTGETRSLLHRQRWQLCF
jgi:hypothetical protein